MINNISLIRPSMPSLDEYINEIEPLWRTHQLTNMGELHQKFEAMLKEKMKVDNISLFSNGHMALELTIQAFGLKGEVITTPFTFASTTHAIVRNGLTPVFCDINLNDLTMDVSKIEALITEQTSAIVPVHVYGNICDYITINKIAKKYNLKVIYDAAHAFLEEIDGISVGNLGDASMFSFHATKVFNSIEGGCVCFQEEKIGRELSVLKNFGIMDEESVTGIGINAKMNEMQAAMGICNLRHIEHEIEKRKKVYNLYRSLLPEDIGIRLPCNPKNIINNYGYFPIVVDESIYGRTRDNLFLWFKENNVVTRKYFYPLVNNYQCYKEQFKEIELPNAEYIANSVLTIPLYADLKQEEVELICKLIIDYKK